ncbi:Transcriptional regulator, MarR family protein [Minicystis rosea]|nr:Transcriptional regulator, MarR family protein [Minicystis rosea]
MVAQPWLCYKKAMKDRAPQSTVSLESLDVGHLALFVGMAVDAEVIEALKRAGFDSLRQSHGFVVQHLVEGPRTVGEIARLLGITQQAVSKSVRELADTGYVEGVESEDGRVRRVQLSARGKASVAASRAARRKIEQRLARVCGDEALADARKVLAKALEALGGAEAVRKRRVRPPG